MYKFVLLTILGALIGCIAVWIFLIVFLPTTDIETAILVMILASFGCGILVPIFIGSKRHYNRAKSIK